jgi:hypothetical protein
MPIFFHWRKALHEKASKPMRITSSLVRVIKRMPMRLYMTETMVSRKVLVDMSCPEVAAKLINAQNSDMTFQGLLRSSFMP